MKKLYPVIYFLACLIIIGFITFGLNSDARLVSKSEKVIDKLGNLYIDENENIISLYAYHGKKKVQENIEPVLSLAKSTNLPVYLAIPPRKMDVYSIPEEIDTAPHKRLFELIEKECSKNDIQFIDLLSVLDKKGLYFATDHHWTSRGAYLAYCEIISKMGKEPVPEIEFTIVKACDSYRGSDYNKSDKTLNIYDTIELYYSESYPSFTTTIVSYPYDSDENNVTLEGMYNSESLNSWDPYTVYFKGNTPYITIRNGRARETLLVIRDSFASALAPFLAEHYDVIMIDPRFCPERLSLIAEKEKASAILVLENMGTFTENTIAMKW